MPQYIAFALLLAAATSPTATAMEVKPAPLPPYFDCSGSGRYCERGPYGDATVEFAFKTRENDDTRIWLPYDGATNSIPAREPMPIVAYVHPMYDKTLPSWIAHNRRTLDHLASHGFAVLATYRVTPMGLRPTFEAAYPVQLFWNIGDHTLEALQMLVAAKANVTTTPSDVSPFIQYIDPTRVGVTGYSVGAALSVRLADRAAEAAWRGIDALRPSAKQPVLGAVSLGPTIGLPRARGGSGGRDELLRIKNRTVPLLLIAGTNDARNALGDVNTLFEASKDTSQLCVKMLLAGGTHCFINVRGGECRGGFCSDCEVSPGGCYRKCSPQMFAQQATAQAAQAAFFSYLLKDDGEEAKRWVTDEAAANTLPMKVFSLEVAGNGPPRLAVSNAASSRLSRVPPPPPPPPPASSAAAPSRPPERPPPALPPPPSSVAAVPPPPPEPSATFAPQIPRPSTPQISSMPQVARWFWWSALGQQQQETTPATQQAG